MKPTLKNGQTIIVSQNRNFKEGDVVLAYMNRREVVKRIARMSDGQVFLLGDNESESSDSRKHGWLVDRHILGKVVWPWVKQR